MNHCGLCERELEHSYLCPGDTLALAGRLDQLPVLHEELAQCLVPRRAGWGEIIATKSAAGPRSPLDEDVLDLVQSNHLGEVVHLWRVDVQRERWPQHSPPPPSGLAADCRWLGMELDWITAHYPAVGDLAREVRELEKQARSIVGDPVPRRQRLGLCVAVDQEGVVCGAVISRLPGQTRIQCSWCRYVYEADDFLTLAALQPGEDEQHRAA